MPSHPIQLPQTTQPLLVACLCAQWCRTCDAYRGVMKGLAADFGDRVQVAWVDIEDHEAALGELDIDDFPTLLIARGGDDMPFFFGPVLPHATTAIRLVREALAGGLPPVVGVPGLAGLAGAIRALPAA